MLSTIIDIIIVLLICSQYEEIRFDIVKLTKDIYAFRNWNSLIAQVRVSFFSTSRIKNDLTVHYTIMHDPIIRIRCVWWNKMDSITLGFHSVVAENKRAIPALMENIHLRWIRVFLFGSLRDTTVDNFKTTARHSEYFHTIPIKCDKRSWHRVTGKYCFVLFIFIVHFILQIV